MVFLVLAQFGVLITLFNIGAISDIDFEDDSQWDFDEYEQFENIRDNINGEGCCLDVFTKPLTNLKLALQANGTAVNFYVGLVMNMISNAVCLLGIFAISFCYLNIYEE